MTDFKRHKDEIAEFTGKYFDNLLKELYEECELLRKWFKRDFPESDLRVLVDADNIRRSFTITVRVLMGEEMVQNRGFFENKIVLSEKEIINPSFMRAFFKQFGNQYRKQIASAVNRHYQQEKANEEAKSK